MGSLSLASLSDCDGMTTDGTKLGTPENITLKPTTGEIEFLCVDPSGKGSAEFPRMENGQVVVSIESRNSTRVPHRECPVAILGHGFGLLIRG